MTFALRPILRRFSGWIPVACLAGAGVCGAPGLLGQGPPNAGAATAPVPQQKAAPRFVVVLDAAHGGDDGGGQLGASVAEKTVTLGLSVRLRSLLAARGIAVVTTREGNVNLDSDQRAQIADHAVAGAGAAACVSLHASQAGAGVHIFVSSLEPAGTTRFLAWKTAQAAYVARSLKLAGTVNSALEHSTAGGDGGDASGAAIPATLARASLPGLDSMTCPAVAIEMAPLRDADRNVVTEVTDQGYQAQVMAALAAALLEWKTDVDPEPRPDSHAGGQAP